MDRLRRVEPGHDQGLGALCGGVWQNIYKNEHRHDEGLAYTRRFSCVALRSVMMHQDIIYIFLAYFIGTLRNCLYSLIKTYSDCETKHVP